MKNNLHLLLALTASLGLTNLVRAQGTLFPYSGQLDDGGTPANGSYVFRFTLFDSSNGSTPVAGPGAPITTGVTNGAFTTALDFGSVFNGAERWLEIEVHTNDNISPFTTLSPRVQILPTPYAIFAGQVDGAGITGTIPAGSIGNSSIASAMFAPGAVGNAQLADGAVTAAKLSPSAPAPGQFLGYNGSALQWTTPAGGGGGWSLTGSSGTDPNVNFLGTIDNRALTLRVYDTPALRILPKGNPLQNTHSPSLIGGSEANQVVGNGYDTPGVTIAGGGAPHWAFGAQLVNHSIFATISGGSGNTITNTRWATIGGGFQNQITAGNTDYNTISGGGRNRISIPSVQGQGNTIAGGYENSIEQPPSDVDSRFAFIGSGEQNTNASDHGVIGGGYRNLNQGSWYSFMGGGQQNTISNISSHAAIAGGQNNRINSSSQSFIGGGSENVIEKPGAGISSSVIVGGYGNRIAAPYAFIGGGNRNTNEGNSSFIGGGERNKIQDGSAWAMIPGGDNNLAWGASAFAAGHRAKAVNHYAFVWADGAEADFASTANNQFLIRAAGGVGINTNQPHSALEVHGTVTATRFVGDGSGLTGVGGGGVADGSITAPKFAASPPSSGQVLSYNGSALAWTTPSGGGSGWSLSGNTIGGGNFLGSANNATVELRANNLTALRIIPGGAAGTSAPNIIGGDANNSIAADVFAAVISGGALNTNLSVNGVIAGGALNTIRETASSSSVLGGFGNRIESGAGFSVIGGGQQNYVRDNAQKSFIGGGQANVISTNSIRSAIAGGFGNQITEAASQSFIGGGKANLIESADARAAGFSVGGASSVIVGGFENKIRNGAFLSFIGSGYQNEIGTNSDNSVIGGGVGNEIESSAHLSTIGGGSGNTIRQSGHESVIAGGGNNEIGTGSSDSTIGGGSHNFTDGINTTIAGGNQNKAIGVDAAILGGSQNTASGIGAIVLGGQLNYATNNYSTASGKGGIARTPHAQVEGVMFDLPGDAQCAKYVLKGQSSGATPIHMLGPEIRESGVITFSALVCAKALGNDRSAGFEIKGVVRNYGGAIAFVEPPTVTTLGRDAYSSGGVVPLIVCDAIVDGNRLAVSARGTYPEVRWVVMLQTAEVIF